MQINPRCQADEVPSKIIKIKINSLYNWELRNKDYKWRVKPMIFFKKSQNSSIGTNAW